MDALLPIKRQARAYEAAVNRCNLARSTASTRCRTATTWSYAGLFPQLVVIQPHAQKAFDLLVDAVEATRRCRLASAFRRARRFRRAHRNRATAPTSLCLRGTRRRYTTVRRWRSLTDVGQLAQSARSGYRLTPRGD